MLRLRTFGAAGLQRADGSSIALQRRPLALLAFVAAIVAWHFHSQARVYHDVIVQVADDPDFITNVKTDPKTILKLRGQTRIDNGA